MQQYINSVKNPLRLFNTQPQIILVHSLQKKLNNKGSADKYTLMSKNKQEIKRRIRKTEI